MVQDSSATESLKRNLIQILKRDYKVTRERMLVDMILKIDEQLSETNELLFYAESQKTHSNDIQVVDYKDFISL